MTDAPEATPADTDEGHAETDWQRKRRLARVFGDVLPETTRDERDPDPTGVGDDWLRSQVPPHHGG